ncbi:MAG TPA: M1 family aminopeptidase, partial [Nitrososphaera sp.]|nr:M1 family aminopeptidase [Nitrososphaera sp.]
SIVIGRYAEIVDGKDAALTYYVPEEQRGDAMRSFERTPQMLKFFEDYFGVKYPYDKYAQVAVQDFVYGGMENSSCTTLTLDTLHDAKADLDFTSDHLVSHELAHQWFGDLVTCRDWQHIWLNEGFATYCEALYWQSSRGEQEFQYYVMETADDYLEEARGRYMRAIVTKQYKHPDDLFDRHSYEKGGIVLHMLRHKVGEDNFRRSIRTYLERYSNGTAETEDLRRIFETESGQSLQQFFDQWIYGRGYPELKVHFSLERDCAKVKIEQVQKGEPFEFPLDVTLASGSDSQDRRTFTLKIEDKECTFQIPVNPDTVEWFSVDSQFKILKSVEIKAPREMLLRQLASGSTVIERVEAARALKNESSEAAIDALKKSIGDANIFWGVAVEAAKTLGRIRTDYAFAALKACIRVKNPKVRRAVIKALGEFRRPEIIDSLRATLEGGDESYFVESEAATAIGKTRDSRAIAILEKALESRTFQNIVAQGAINGLKEFPDEKEIGRLLAEKSRYGNHHRIREAATFALGKFLDTDATIIDHLTDLLRDKWFRVRINACRALADAECFKAIPDLQTVADNDLDHRVRRVAEECIAIIKQSKSGPEALTQLRDELGQVRSKNLE